MKFFYCQITGNIFRNKVVEIYLGNKVYIVTDIIFTDTSILNGFRFANDVKKVLVD